MKGVMELLKSAEIVCREIPNVRYLIAGRPMLNDYTRALMQFVDESPQLKRSVRFLGWLSREQLEGLYAIADLMLAPSIFEPFCYSALEAMAAGVPVIATETGGLPEVVSAVGGGMVVPLEVNETGTRRAQKDSLAAAQIQLLRDDRGRLDLANSARTQAPKAFPVEKMIDGTLNAYRAAIAGHAAQ
jgi:glycosyltransferase involved in cell wall biosynthesis